MPLVTAAPAPRALLWSPGEVRIVDLVYDLLSYLESGRSVLRPVGTSPEAQHQFAQTVWVLRQLRHDGHVSFPDSRISQTEDGTYLAVGPIDLTPAGRAALARDRSLGERPPRSYDRPWRVEA